MDTRNERLLAWLLIGLGGIALLSRIGNDSGWLWIALVAAGFLAAYYRERTYGFLVVGSVLGGISLGVLLEGSWGWSGAYLVSLGAGFLAIDRIEPRPSRWPIYPGGTLVVLGLLVGLFDSGVLQSLWFALLLLAAGVYLLQRQPRQRPGADMPAAGYGDGDGGAGADPATRPGRPGPVPRAGEIARGDAATATAESTPGEGSEPADALAPAVPAPPEAAASGPTEACRAELEAWREELAHSESRPAGRVLSDEVLERLARERPRSAEELMAVRGVGPVTVERHGEQLLAILRRHGG